MANALMSKLLKSVGKSSRASVLASSDFVTKDMVFQSRVPIINLMIGGSLDAGVSPGIHQLVGESRTFKCACSDTPLNIYVTDEIYNLYFKDRNGVQENG